MIHRFSFGMTLFIVGIAAGTFAADDRPKGYEGHQLVRIEMDEATLPQIQRLLADPDHFELWSEVLRPGPTDLRISSVGKALLEWMGIEHEVLIADLQAYFDEVYGGDRDAGFFDTLRTYSEHEAFIDGLVAAHPNLTQKFSIGQSHQGRSIFGIKITGPGYAKPAVFYQGAQHGNEQAPSSVIQYVANHLLTNYATDPNVAALVDNVVWYLIPISNPDGYVINRRYNARNVDLNRNWDGPGSGQDPYGGPYPFSELETQHYSNAMKADPTIRVHVDLHGYVPWVMWPWGHTYEYTRDHEQFKAVGYVFRDKIAESGGGTYTAGTIREVAYFVSGCSSNYAYGVLNEWAFGIEVRNSSMPAICQQFLKSMLWLGQWIRDFDCNANSVPDTKDIADHTSTDFNGNGKPDECEGLGDLNCNGQIDFGDINPFVLALSDPDEYQRQYPNCPFRRRDINGDGSFDFGDINPFVVLLSR